MATRLVVLGQDPRFGGGSAAQTRAFISGVAALGRQPEFRYDAHPGLGEPRVTWRRVEALRQIAAARRLEGEARDASSLWVVASLAQNGGAAARAGRPYGCWIGTTIRSEWEGRRAGLTRRRRVLAGASIPLLARLERRVLREATRVYATSPSSRSELASAAGLEEASIEILPIPVDTEYFEPAAPEVWLEAASGPVLTFVGRADDPRKNVRMLLAAFTQLRKEFPGSRLRLVGRPTGYCVPEGVEVVGEVEDLARELAKASLFVLPSRQEGFGIVAAEAMAAGLPVVTTPSGGPEALVRRSGGGVVAVSHSARAFADAIAETVSNIPRLTEMRSLAREYVEREHSPAAFEGALRSALTAVETTS